ncbi:integrin beta-like protein A [Oculina patagonica]
MKMDLAGKCIIWIVCFVLVHDAVCTHFRGGTFTYKPVNPSDPANTTVIITFRIGWRSTYNSFTFCDQSTINSGQLIGINDDLECRDRCSGSVGKLLFRCTDFSTNEDWTTGTNSFQYTFPVPAYLPPYYQVSYQGFNWISLVYNSEAAWELRMYVNLTVRNDTGRLNTSPVTTMTPIVRLKWGCNHTINIPVTDTDNDEVRCRWASGSSECGGICGGYGLPNARMYHRECKITYSATDHKGYYAAAAMIEDFAEPTATEALSSIPLQFLVYVSDSNEPCDERPEFTELTRAKGSCIGIAPGGTYFDRIIVRAGGSTKSIVEVTTSSPPGFIKSAVAQYAPQEYYVNVTWTPTTSQIETKLFCFTGLENSG